ncbi:Trypsin theta [Operophtera brumata]|uniref:Trypsin theta n=1 Tax=Operophtera brumata TaxID=104452 RepID=A0A0L7LDS8_OPEBR|nr:Trypsin theta [Operophtera brumata]
MCCDVCCKGFKGWCRAFTRTERALTVLEAVLLVIFVVLIIFLILHLLACSSQDRYETITEIPEEYVTDEPEEGQPHTEKHDTTLIQTTTRTTTTIDPGVECSWTPSAKTPAGTHYHEQGATQAYTQHTPPTTHKIYTKLQKEVNYVQTKPDVDDFIQSDQSNEEDAETLQNKYVFALVKLRPPQDVVFGCILTMISDYWLLTSASCIEAIEEVDSLDSFFIMEGYGSSSNGKIQSVLDVQIHPYYQGMNKSYDLAALKSESNLVSGRAVQLPTLLDYSMTTVGERFSLLGFGAYRSIDKSPKGRSLRHVRVYRLPASQCPGSEAWSLRHLQPGRAVPATPCGAGTLCAGVLYARGLPCNYCGGTPLLRGALLLGVMSDNRQCGVACEPQLYVSVAAVRDWIDSVVLNGQ